MILDFIMTPVHGDTVVEEIRKFNKDLYIILLTGHKDLAPPLETIRRLDIQGYCEKSDKQDQLLLLIESGIKSIAQMKIIKQINVELQETYNKLEQAYLDSIQTVSYTHLDVYKRQGFYTLFNKFYKMLILQYKILKLLHQQKKHNY